MNLRHNKYITPVGPRGLPDVIGDLGVLQAGTAQEPSAFAGGVA